MCSGSRRRRGCAGAGVGKSAGGVAARAVAARHGEAGAGQRGPGKRRCGCWGGTWHGLERRGGGRCTAHGRQGRRGIGRIETEEPRARGRRRGLFAIS
jgi:hypothetical protein